MGKLGFLAGMAAGYVLGAKAGKQRYAQIKTLSGKVWQSAPVQNQVAQAKQAAKTKAAPMVADLVGDAAKQTAERLRAQRVVPSQLVDAESASPRTQQSDPWTASPAGQDPWAQATPKA